MAKGIGLYVIILTEQSFPGKLITRKVLRRNSGMHIITCQADGAIGPHGLSGWCVVNV